MTSVSSKEIAIDPRHPRRLEKNKNTGYARQRLG
jgi:hypothetical protein